MSGSGFPQIEINKMHISQSIEVKHTDASPSARGLSEGTRINEMCSWDERVCSGFSHLYLSKDAVSRLKKEELQSRPCSYCFASMSAARVPGVRSFRVSGLSSRKLSLTL